MPDDRRNGRRARRSRSDADQAPASGAAVPTFAGLAGDAIARRAPHWRDPRTERSYRQLLENHVLPHLGDLRVDRIDADAVARVVLPHWQGPAPWVAGSSGRSRPSWILPSSGRTATAIRRMPRGG